MLGVIRWAQKEQRKCSWFLKKQQYLPADLERTEMPTERMASTLRKGQEFLAKAGPSSSPIYGKKGTMASELTGRLALWSIFDNRKITRHAFRFLHRISPRSGKARPNPEEPVDEDEDVQAERIRTAAALTAANSEVANQVTKCMLMEHFKNYPAYRLMCRFSSWKSGVWCLFIILKYAGASWECLGSSKKNTKQWFFSSVEKNGLGYIELSFWNQKFREAGNLHERHYKILMEIKILRVIRLTSMFLWD